MSPLAFELYSHCTAVDNYLTNVGSYMRWVGEPKMTDEACYLEHVNPKNGPTHPHPLLQKKKTRCLGVPRPQLPL